MDQHGMRKKYRLSTWKGEEAKGKPIGRVHPKTILARIRLRTAEVSG